LAKHDSHFDVVINNAGYLINKPFTDCSTEEIFSIYKTNVFAPMTLIKQIVPLLDRNRLSHIVNIGSIGGFHGSVKFTGHSKYSSSKAALGNLTECLAEEYKDKNIYFNCLALGSVQTEMLNNAFPGFEAQVSAKEMASYIYNFTIQRPLYINGKVIPVSNSTP
jgi:short-subunit dehydrogenase